MTNFAFKPPQGMMTTRHYNTDEGNHYVTGPDTPRIRAVIRDVKAEHNRVEREGGSYEGYSAKDFSPRKVKGPNRRDREFAGHEVIKNEEDYADRIIAHSHGATPDYDNIADRLMKKHFGK